MNTQKTHICAYFLRTTAQAEAFQDHVNELAGKNICTIDHTVVSTLGSSLEQADALFHTISRSLDAFNLKYILDNTDSNWLDNYQTASSLGVVSMHLIETDNIADSINQYRISCIINPDQVISTASQLAPKVEEFAHIMLNKAKLTFSLRRIELQRAISSANELIADFDFIDYTQLYEYILRPIIMRSLDENDLKACSDNISQILSEKQNTLDSTLNLKQKIYKVMLSKLQSKTSLPESDLPAAAMKLTKSLWSLKSGLATQAVCNEYDAISKESIVSMKTLLAPIKKHQQTLVLTECSKTA